MVRHTIATLAVVCVALTASAGVRHPTPTLQAASAGYGILAAPQEAWVWPPLLPVPVSALKSGGAVAADLEAEQAKHAAAVVAWQMAETLGRLRAEERRAVKARAAPTVRAAAVQGSGACGGDLPPCSVMMCESGGNLRAKNPRSSASGKWQITSGSWAGHGGYARAMDAPEAVQDERARQLYAGGRGRRHWVC